MFRIKQNVLKLTKNIRKLQNFHQFCFSDSCKGAEKILIQEIDTELNYEREAYLVPSPHLKEFIEKNNWTYLISDDSTRIELRKKIENLSIQVVYNALALEDDKYKPEYQREVQIARDYICYVEFLVILDNGISERKMVFDLVADSHELNINAIFYHKDIEGLLDNKKLLYHNLDYGGPNMYTINDQLRTEMMEFLKSIGVDDELIGFIEQTSVLHETKLYSLWLEDIKNCLE